MPQTTYTYSIANDTLNGAADAGRLKWEYEQSAIVTALDHIDIGLSAADNLDVVCKDALSGGDQTILNGLVAAHTGAALATGPALDADGNLITTLKGGETQIGMQSVQVLNTPDISSDLIKSYQITAAAQVTEIMDIFIGGDLVGSQGLCYLAGGEYRCRTDVAEGSALNFQIVDRNDVLGLFSLYGMSRTKLSGLTNFAGGTIANVNVGEYAHGDTSGAKSKVLGKGADYLEVEFHEATFQDGEDLTIKLADGTATGVTCTLGTWDEGDVISVLDSVKDEWVEGYDVRDVHPGGSKQVPEGMYFRVKFYNNHATDPARIKVSLTVGRL